MRRELVAGKMELGLESVVIGNMESVAYIRSGLSCGRVILVLLIHRMLVHVVASMSSAVLFAKKGNFSASE